MKMYTRYTRLPGLFLLVLLLFSQAAYSFNPSLAINEYLASNDSIIADETGAYDDWIEIYNYGSAAVDLSTIYLTDNPDIPNKWKMPDTTLGPDAYLLIWADDDNGQGPLHTNFKLDKEGEFIGIYDSLATGFEVVDSLSYGPQTTDVSIGRIPNGTGPFQELEPSPGASNTGTTSIDLLHQLELVINVGPIPARQTLNVEIQNPRRLPLRSNIIDLNGRRIWESELEKRGYNEQIMVRNLPKGIYILLIEHDGTVVYKRKLVKM